MYASKKEIVTTSREEIVEIVICDADGCGREDFQFGSNIQSWFRVNHMSASDPKVYPATLHFHSLECLLKTLALGDPLI